MPKETRVQPARVSTLRPLRPFDLILVSSEARRWPEEEDDDEDMPDDADESLSSELSCSIGEDTDPERRLTMPLSVIRGF